jgi:hypothetical protein
VGCHGQTTKFDFVLAMAVVGTYKFLRSYKFKSNLVLVSDIFCASPTSKIPLFSFIFLSVPGPAKSRVSRLCRLELKLGDLLALYAPEDPKVSAPAKAGVKTEASHFGKILSVLVRPKSSKIKYF